MASPTQNVVSDACICGRSRSRIHCPRCGCYTIYARSAKKNTLRVDADSKTISLRTFNCRRCGSVFDEEEWQLRCEAPAPLRASSLEPSLRIAPQASANGIAGRDLASDPAAPEKLLEAIEQYKKKRGW